MSSSINTLTSQQIEYSQRWTHEFYKLFDTFDLKNWLTKYCKSDAILNLCNNPTMKGHDEIYAHFENNSKPVLTSMKHNLIDIYVLSDRIYVQNEGVFVIKNDPEQQEIKVKAMGLLWKNIDEDQVSAMDVFYDPMPIFERIKMFS